MEALQTSLPAPQELGKLKGGKGKDMDMVNPLHCGAPGEPLLGSSAWIPLLVLWLQVWENRPRESEGMSENGA